MTIKYRGQSFTTDNDLQATQIGFWPGMEIQNKELKKLAFEETGSMVLGGDMIISYVQTLVSKSMDIERIEENILKDAKDPNKGGLKQILFNKTATGIGRGHSLGGLSGMAFAIRGTKMIDSGLTGLVISRSLATSSRRRETDEGEIVIPECLKNKPELLKEYMDMSSEVFELSAEFKTKFGKLNGIETFNKILSYNSPADLIYIASLDSMASLAHEVENDSKSEFLPKEVHKLVEMFPDLTKKVGLDTMYNQRIRVPRDSYFHYHPFKDPSKPNRALELGLKHDMSLDPKIDSLCFDNTLGFQQRLSDLKKVYESARSQKGASEIFEKSKKAMLALRELSNEYNDAVNITLADSLSWRVWSEQKRHATLRQNVESIYSATDRAYNGVKNIWPEIKSAFENKQSEKFEKILEDLEKFINFKSKYLYGK